MRVLRGVAVVALVGVVASCKLRGAAASDAGTSGRGVFSALAALVSFEGEIEMRTKGGSGAFTGFATVFRIKGPKLRSEMSALGTDYVNISDMETKKSLSLDTKRRTYTETDLSASKTSSRSTTKAVATGRTDRVAGYACDVYEIEDTSAPGTPPAEICVASGISTVAFGLSGPFSYFTNRSNDDDAWGAALSHGFPLRITLRDPKGSPVMTLEATRVDKKDEPDSLFEAPAGYAKMPPLGGPASGASGSGP
jgi:hypothetical protein